MRCETSDKWCQRAQRDIDHVMKSVSGLVGSRYEAKLEAGISDAHHVDFRTKDRPATQRM
jgi:hypothetical protein